jgi:haloalkane dehalogenase
MASPSTPHAATHTAISSAFPFTLHYVDVLDSRMAYVDTGTPGDSAPSDSPRPTVVFLHGNPTSSYLWRNVIPHISPQARCIAPDLIGQGASDKPQIGYRFFDHAAYLDAFFDAVVPASDGPVVLVLHDWGSGLGFHWASRHPERVSGIAFMEAILGPVSWEDFPGGFKLAFKLFRTPGTGFLMNQVFNMFVNKILPGAVHGDLSPEAHAHYKAPFPTIASRLPAAQWPREIPIEGQPADVHAAAVAWNAYLRSSDVPKLLLYASPGGLISPDRVPALRESMPNLETVDIGAGLHFVQEDNPDGIGRAIAAWMKQQ